MAVARRLPTQWSPDVILPFSCEWKKFSHVIDLLSVKFAITYVKFSKSVEMWVVKPTGPVDADLKCC